MMMIRTITWSKVGAKRFSSRFCLLFWPRRTLRCCQDVLIIGRSTNIWFLRCVCKRDWPIDQWMNLNHAGTRDIVLKLSEGASILFRRDLCGGHVHGVWVQNVWFWESIRRENITLFNRFYIRSFDVFLCKIIITYEYLVFKMKLEFKVILLLYNYVIFE